MAAALIGSTGRHALRTETARLLVGTAVPGRGMTRDMRRRPPPPAITALAVAATVSGTLAWRDLNRRLPGQVRGSKRLWRVLITLNPGNSVLYWLFGRR
jgi:hypothetical protein